MATEDVIRVNTMDCMPTVEDVETWIWEKSREHRGLVPRMNCCERAWWVLLSTGSPRGGLLTDAERAVFVALDCKIRYRAERDLTEDF